MTRLGPINTVLRKFLAECLYLQSQFITIRYTANQPEGNSSTFILDASLLVFILAFANPKYTLAVFLAACQSKASGIVHSAKLHLLNE